MPVGTDSKKMHTGGEKVDKLKFQRERTDDLDKGGLRNKKDRKRGEKPVEAAT